MLLFSCLSTLKSEYSRQFSPTKTHPVLLKLEHTLPHAHKVGSSLLVGLALNRHNKSAAEVNLVSPQTPPQTT